jgi:hypothetical protein
MLPIAALVSRLLTTVIMNRVLSFSLLVLAACGETPPAPSICTSYEDCNGDQICVSGTCEVAVVLAIVTDALPLGKIGEPYAATVEARGGSTPYTFELTTDSALPAGLDMEASGAISGVPAQAGTASFTVQVTDAGGVTASKALFIGIKPDIGDPLRIVTEALSNGAVGVAYRSMLNASGGSAPYVFSLANGALPAGLTLAPDGTLAGTPVSAGTAVFSVQASDASDPKQLATAGFTLVIAPSNGEALAITTLSLPDGAIGQSYSATLEATGGQPPYAWSLAGGTTLPSGLVLDPSGAISGAPSQEGTVTFFVRVTDGAQEATVQLSIRIGAGAVAIDTTSLPGGEVGVAYTAAIVASGGTAPYSFSISSGTLPAGLQLAADGRISGTPAGAGTFAFTAQVTDGSSPAQVAARAYSIAIVSAENPNPLALTVATLPDATVGVAYSAQLTASGGTPPYSFSLDAGSALPPGLNLAPNGTIDGAPMTAGRFAFTVTVIDSSATPQSASAGFTITVIDPTSGLVITTAILPNGRVDAAYQQQLQASGGSPPYGWAVIAGALPDGITLSADGVLSGTPSTAGGYNFTVEVTDAAGATAQAPLSLAINAGMSQVVIITTGALPPATVNRAYSVQLAAMGGSMPYTWTLASGSLPDGITLSAGGLLAGTASVAGAYSFAVQVIDGANPANSDSRQYSLTVIATPGAGLSLVNAFLPPARVGASYTANLIAAGGTTPYTFGVSAGALPPGLTLATTGRITGTATTDGTYSFTVRVTDSASPSASAQRIFSITVRAAGVMPGGQLTITTATLPPGRVNVPYSGRLNAIGGTTPYQWSLAGGALPDGITLAVDGTISGTATAAGSFSVTFQVTDASTPARTASKSFSLTIQGR